MGGMVPADDDTGRQAGAPTATEEGAEGGTGQGQASGPADDASVPFLRRGMLREAARASDSYGLLLFLVFVDYLLLSVPWEGSAQVITSTIVICLTALLAFHTSHVRGRWLTAVRIASVIAVVASVNSAIFHTHRAVGTTFAIIALLILATPIAVVSRIIKHTRVTAETLMGAVAVYVLIGLVFSYADYAVQLVTGHSFFAQSGQFNEQDFVYYSFITVTTVGYGDLTPTTGMPRTFAVTEALAGQIFLVVMVSRLVAMYSPRASGERRRLLAAGLRGGVDDVEDVEDVGVTEPEPGGGPEDDGPGPATAGR